MILHNFKQILLILGYILLFCFISYFFQDICIFDTDDLNSTIVPYPLWREENGRYVFNILSRIFCMYIPNIAGVHVQNALSTMGAGIYAIIQLILFSVIGCFCFIKNKNTFVFLLLFLFATATFYCNYVNEFCFFYTIISFQYGYVLASATVLLFLFFIYNYVLNGKLPNKKYLWLTCILGFCAGNSTQFMCYTLAITLVFLFFTYFARRKFRIKKLNFLIKQKRIFHPVLSFFAGLTLMVSCPGFWHEVSWRHAKSTEEIKNIFIPFCQEYYNTVILKYQNFFYFILFLILAVLIIGIIKKKFKKNFLECVIICFPIAGAFGYFFTLILAGATFPSKEFEFWIYEPFYHFCYLMILCSVISMLFGLLFSVTKKQIIKIFLCIIFVLFSIQILKPVSVETYINIKDSMKDIRTVEYINEKMLLYYFYNGIEQMQVGKMNIPYKKYVYKIYKIKLLSEPVHVQIEDAILYYNSLGGTFTEEELEKTDFQKLYDKNFVLNKKGE